LKTGLKCPNCSCLGFTLEEDGNAKCLSCGTIYKNRHPMEQSNEPSTKVIIQALRIAAEKYGNRKPICDETFAADRLESHERKIKWLLSVQCRGCVHRNIDCDAEPIEFCEAYEERNVATLTARAEQAERERDAAVHDIEWAIFDAGLCNLCLNRRGDDCVAKKCKPKWRGLPQDGEGK